MGTIQQGATNTAEEDAVLWEQRYEGYQQRYDHYQQLLDAFHCRQDDFQRQRLSWGERWQAHREWRASLEQAKREQEQRRILSKKAL